MSTSLNKKSLRVVFMGTPDFAVASLKQLLEHDFNVVGVVSAPDRPAGRGRKLKASAVKEFAQEQGITVLQPTNLKDEAFIEQLRRLQADLQVVVAFRMLPKVVWEMPGEGTFNLHASLLPDYRGAAPINWAIINGETETGVTTFFIDEQIDTGSIILQRKCSIDSDDNAGTLHDRLMDLGAELVVETCRKIENGTVQSTPQLQVEDVKKAPKIHKENCRINWTLPIERIHDHIRGLSPYPTAWTELVNGPKTDSIKIYRSKAENDFHNHETGKLFHEGRSLKVAVQGGYLHLLEIQMPGKRRMDVSEVLNGLNLEKSAHLR